MEEYRGRSIVVRFDGAKCIHSRHCVLEQPAVFEANVRGPWIHPDAASVEGVVQIAYNCPSGAITYERLEGGAQESAPTVNTVHVRENGPLAFRAELVVGGKPAGYRARRCAAAAPRRASPGAIPATSPRASRRAASRRRPRRRLSSPNATARSR